MAVTVTPIAGSGTALRLLGGKLFTNHIAKLMGTGLENVEIFRGECIGCRPYTARTPTGASVKQRNRQVSTAQSFAILQGRVQPWDALMM